MERQIPFDITPRAIEQAAQNLNGVRVLALLLRTNSQVTITDQALEFAASNAYNGFHMVKHMMSRWKGEDGFEGIIGRAAGNPNSSHEIIAYLTTQRREIPITSDIIQACVTSPFADKRTISILFEGRPSIRLGQEIVEAAASIPQRFFDILTLLREHDPYISVSNAAIRKVVWLTYNIIETIKRLREFNRHFTITEATLKAVVTNTHANDSTIVCLQEFQADGLASCKWQAFHLCPTRY